MIRRLDHSTARHPILSMIAGYLLLVAFAMAALPDDPPSVDAAMHGRVT